MKLTYLGDQEEEKPCPCPGRLQAPGQSTDCLFKPLDLEPRKAGVSWTEFGAEKRFRRTYQVRW